MIYTLTFNPSLDYIMHIDTLEIGKTNRSLKEEIYPGGKGFNVSTILQRLQIENTAFGFIAGFTGQEIKRRLLDRGFHLDLIELKEGNNRINIKLKGQQETEINANGPHISNLELNQLFEQLNQIQAGDSLILAGSIPTSLPHDLYEQIMKYLQNKDVQIIVDASKEVLRLVLRYHPFLIKPNLQELEEFFDKTIHSQEEIITYAKKLQELGATNVLVSLGKDGAILVTKDSIYYAPSAKGILINSVGSGDSMVAGFLAGYLKSNDYQEALHLGTACGGATAFSEDLAEFDKIQEVYQQIKIQQLY